MLRRRFIKLAGGAAAGAALPLRAPRVHAAPAIAAERVVIIGGGFSGAHAASRLKSMAPDLDVLLIDRNEDFLIGPLVLDYVFGRLELDRVVVGYDGLRERGVQVRRADVFSIDPHNGAVETSAGRIPFTRLVLTTGCRFAFEDIEGLSDDTADNLSLYDRRKIADLRKRVAALEDETIVVGIPDSRLVCPPAPYEFVLLLAESIRERQAKTRVLVLDANVTPQPEPLAEFFRIELERYQEIVEYVFSVGQIESIDTAAKTVRTRFGDEHAYSWLSVFPRGSVADFVRDLDLKEAPGATFVNVEPLTMKTVKYPNIFAAGDVAQLPYGKSAFTAFVSGSLCARAIAAEIGVGPPIDDTKVDVACFPHVDKAKTLGMRVRYDLDRAADALHIKSAARIDHSSIENCNERKQWLESAVQAGFVRSLGLAPI